MTYKKLVIEYKGNDSIAVEYRLLDHDVVQKWAERVITAQVFPYPIDDKGRFYGFGPLEQQIETAINAINTTCDKIEKFGITVSRRLDTITDQDTLNFLHHVFETHHGLLDAKRSESALDKLLCDLNLLVHKCEGIQRGAKPRHVVTYYGLPKDRILELEDYNYFTNEYKFGTVYLNYAEIGKTFEDLTYDNDQYISDDAFQPYKHYSADFNVKFFNSDPIEILDSKKRMTEYYAKNINFFQQRGLNADSPLLKPGSIPLAELETPLTLKDIEPRQWVKSVNLYE
jgi:hypothetical protein